jgi:WD40 repeat protein
MRSGPLEPPIEEPILTVPASPTPFPAVALRPLYTLTQTVSLFAVSPESSYLATTDDDVITIWDTAGGKWTTTIYEQAAAIGSLAFTPNGANLLGRNESVQFHRWLAYNGSYQRLFEGPITALETPFDLGNTVLVIVTADNKLEVWPLIGDKPNRAIYVTGQPITAVAVSADGQSFAAQVEDGSVYIWNEKTKMMEALNGPPETASGLEFNRDGRQLAIFNDNTIQIWRENNLQHQLTAATARLGPIDSVQFISDDQFLLVNYSGGFLQSWDVNSGDLVKTFEGQTAVQTAVGLTRNSLLYLTLNSQNELTVWEKPEE